MLLKAVKHQKLLMLNLMDDLYVEDETSPYGGGPIRDVIVNSVEIIERIK